MNDKRDVERLIKALRAAMRLLNLTSREIERRLGLKPSYLSRLFTGRIELRLAHVLAIARAMGLQPAELFDLAYAAGAEPPSETFLTIWKLLHDFQPPEPRRPAITVEEIDRRAQESVRRVIIELAKGG